MKRKIFSIFFALVLICSFSLVTAVPVGAAVGESIFSVTDGEYTTTWVSDENGTISATLDGTWGSDVIGDFTATGTGGLYVVMAEPRWGTTANISVSGALSELEITFEGTAVRVEGDPITDDAVTGIAGTITIQPDGSFVADLTGDIAGGYTVEIDISGTMAVDVVGADVTLVMPENVYRPAEFDVSGTVTNLGWEYANARFNITLSGPEAFTGVPADTFTITAVNGGDTEGINGTFVLVDGDWVGYWGPATGFPLPASYEVTTVFTVEMDDTGTAPVGDYDVTVELVDIEDPESPSILATATESFSLSDDALYVGETVFAYQFNTIQDAIDSATGTTIYVAAGLYDPFTVDTKTNLTIQADGAVIVQGAQGVTIAYDDGYGSFLRDCVVFVNDSTNIVLDGLDIQGLDLGSIVHLKNYGVIYENSSGEIKGCTVSPNTVGDMSSIAIGIWDGSAEVTVDDACTIKNFGRLGMLIYDGCTVEVLDSTIIGQVYSDVDKVCYGIEVEGFFNDATPGTGSQVTIRGNEIYNCDNTFYEAPTWQSGGVYINGWMEYYAGEDSTVIVENNDIHNNYSGIIVIASPSSYAHFNNIYDNRAFGVESLPAHDASTAVFDAQNNYWGAAKGPSGEGSGDGDVVSTNVDYIPWLDAEYPEGEATHPVYNSTTGEPYDSIQDAVDNATADDTLIIGPGTYVGEITVSENVTLIAPDGAKLEGTGPNPVVTIGDVTATLEGFEIDPGSEGVYIIDDISAGNVVTLENLIIHGNGEEGIEVAGTVYGTLNIIDCIIAQNGWDGIYINLVDDGGIVVIQGNKIGAWEDADNAFDGNDSCGIHIYKVYDGSSVTIGGDTQEKANVICDNSNEGIYVEELFYDSTLTIRGNAIGAFAYDGYTFDGNSYGIYVDYVDYGSTVTIKDNNIAENSNDGVYIAYVGYDTSDPDWLEETEAEYYALFQTYGASNVTIKKNMVVGNGDQGIYVDCMDFASTLTIQDNDVSENYDGIYVAYYGEYGGTFYNDPATYPGYFGPVVLVKGNTITDNEDYGIYCDGYYYGTSVTIEGNTISENLYGGIYHCCGPSYGSSITIRGNTIVSNGIDGWNGGIYMGDYIEYDSSYTVEGNFIAGNFGDGIYIEEVYDDSSLIVRGNTIGAGTRDGMSFAGNDGYGLYIYAVYDYSSAEISGNTIAENANEGIYLDEVYEDSSVSITSNNILNNGSDGIYIYDVYYEDSSVDINYNNIVGNNGDGVYYSWLSWCYVVDATNNWWGDKSGPSNQGPGIGDGVSEYVHFSPWLTSLSVWEIKATLGSGWITLSTPIALDSTSDELAELGLDMVEAYGFYNGIWVQITDDNDKLVPCDAFYVKMNSSATIDLVPSPGKTDPPTRPLSEGWNLVGLANLSDMGAKKALKSAYLVPGDLSGYAQVVSPSGNMGSWSYVRGGTDVPDMLPTEGYWVFMTNAGTLAGFTFTPVSLN